MVSNGGPLRPRTAAASPAEGRFGLLWTDPDPAARVDRVVKLAVRLHPEGRRRRNGLASAAVAAIAAVTGASVLLPAVPARIALADQIASTRQQVAAAEAQVVAGAHRVHQLTVAYAQASLQVSALQGLVATGQAEVARLQASVNQASSRLRQETIDSYTGAYTGVPSLVAAPPNSPLDDPAVRAGYVSIASGDLQDSLDSYRTSQHQLSQAQSLLASRERESVAAATVLQRARDAAIAEASTDQTRLNSLQAQLTNLETVQAAQQAAAAAAAAASAARVAAQNAAAQVAAAQAAAAARAKAAAPVTPPSGPPVNNGLLTVVQNTVNPPAPAPTTTPGGGAGGVWLQLRQCESGDNYQANTGNGYYGAYQFSQQTWSNLGYPGRPDLESASMQDQAAMQLQQQSGWGQWPACSAALGLS